LSCNVFLWITVAYLSREKRSSLYIRSQSSIDVLHCLLSSFESQGDYHLYPSWLCQCMCQRWSNYSFWHTPRTREVVLQWIVLFASRKSILHRQRQICFDFLGSSFDKGLKKTETQEFYLLFILFGLLAKGCASNVLYPWLKVCFCLSSRRERRFDYALLSWKSECIDLPFPAYYCQVNAFTWLFQRITRKEALNF
jgi:hypothetical protein